MTDEPNLQPPRYVDWPLFPFEGSFTVKQPMWQDADPPRSGEPGGTDCEACAAGDDGCIWVDEHWRVRPRRERSSVPALLFLETHAHVDLDGLDDDRAAEMGRLIVRLDRAVQAIGGIGRVQVYRWADGGSHFHMWIYACPVGAWSMLGFGMPLWEPILPPVPADVWHANLTTIARELARGGGTALV